MIQGVDLHPVYQKDYLPRPQDHYVIIKATEGRTVSYPHRQALVSRCRAAGKMIGHYHWLWPGDIEDQLDFFAAKAGVLPGDLVCCDWEQASPNQVPAKDLEAWVRAAEKRFPQNRVLTYTYVYYGPFRATGGEVYLGNGGLWIADYRANGPQNIFDLPWVIHQYTDDPIDHDRAQFSTVQAMEDWTKALIPKPPIVPPIVPPTEPLPPLPPTDTEIDMATTAELQTLIRAELMRPQFLDAVAKRVLTLDGVIESTGFLADPKANPFITLESAIKIINKKAG